MVFAEYEDIPFEDAVFKCPKNYDQYLSSIYGDYMQLPKESERAGHGKVEVCFDTTKE